MLIMNDVDILASLVSFLRLAAPLALLAPMPLKL